MVDRLRDIECWAKEFHDTYEQLAPDFGYETRKASAVPWEDVPDQNKALMIAVVGHVMAGAVGDAQWQKAEVHRLRAIMAEAVKRDAATCRKWIRDALDSMPGGQSETRGGIDEEGRSDA